jgi:hypothetical protein
LKEKIVQFKGRSPRAYLTVTVPLTFFSQVDTENTNGQAAPDRQNGTGRTRQAELIGRMGQQKTTCRTRLSDQAGQDKNAEGRRTARTDSQDKTARTVMSGGQAERDSQNGIGSVGTGRTG